VLVVEDHDPFRRVLCELLRERADVLIVGEAADGVEAVRQAEALRPDVVMLDIALPTMNGVDAAARIRATVPDAKVMFVTNESSLEVVEQAFKIGAHGYVYKPRTRRDVLPVFDAIIRGGGFVSGGLERVARGDSLASHRHDLLFCSSDTVLVDGFSRFIAGVLSEGNVVIALVTEAHDISLRRRLQASRDLASAIGERRYIPVKINELLAKVMVDGWPDPTRFLDATEELVIEAARRATGKPPRVAAVGECSPTVWEQGYLDAAIQLEHLWDEMAKSRQMDVLCAYSLTAREKKVQAVRTLCAEHTAVEIS
jgi:DNA-binding NarL/FixJ family response regulator